MSGNQISPGVKLIQKQVPKIASTARFNGNERALNRHSPLGVALAVGASVFALVGYEAAHVNAATLGIPGTYYKCPEDYLNMKYAPILTSTAFNESPDNSQPDKANLSVYHDNTAYNLSGKSVEVTNGCVGPSFEQYQVINNGLGRAEGVTFEASLADDSSGNVLNPHNLAVNKILRVTQTNSGTFKMPDNSERPLDSCTTNADQTTVSCSLPGLDYQEQEVLRVYYTSKSPVFGQDYVANVSTSTPETGVGDNNIHYQKNIYPHHLNIFDKSDQPRFSNGRARRLGKSCIVRPIRVTPPRLTQADLGPAPLYRGKAVADVYYSRTRDYSHARHKRIKVPFTAITDSKPLAIPIKVCNTPAQRFIEAKLSVSAVNTLDVQPFSMVANLVRPSKLHGKRLRGPAWSFDPVLR